MRRSLIAAAALTSTALLAACGGGSPSTGASGDAAASGAAGQLVVYTNSGSDGRDAWLTDKAKAAGFDIQVVQAGGGDTKNKLINEVNNPVADVAYGLNNFYFEQVVKAGAIEPYNPSWADKVDLEMGDATGAGNYWPIVQQGIVLVYNPAGKAGVPNDWPDLWTKSEWKERYETPASVTGATTQLVLSGILTRYTDPNGEMGISADGWKAVEQFFANGNPAEKDVDMFKRLADGTVDAGQMFTSGIPGREEQYKIKVAQATPEVGVPYAIEQVALVKGSKNKEQAQKFIDWFGAAELQSEWSKQFTTMPANKDAIANADPAVVKLHEGLKQQNIDWAFVGENIDGWVEKITLEYLG
ncbi:MAG: extracellular solute-binding protein [Dermatophilus congolensis]|nr:extracellular solute-binding protein [Dermatophilus congolensis]